VSVSASAAALTLPVSTAATKAARSRDASTSECVIPTVCRRYARTECKARRTRLAADGTAADAEAMPASPLRIVTVTKEEEGRRAPGIALVAALVLGGLVLHRVVPSVSPLLWAMGLGVVAAPLMSSRRSTTAGVRFAATRLLRIGVALLGLRISVHELAAVGFGGLVVAAATIAATLAATWWIGRLLGVAPKLALLIGTGSAICGASAIAAMDAVARARDEEVGYAVATVTVFGTAAMLLLPPAASALGLSDTEAGLWAGASIHEVAQATAAGGGISVAALKVATLVKLCRVVLLAPTVALVARRLDSEGGGARMPGFVVAFVALVAVRSGVHVPPEVLDAALAAPTVLLAAGLAALGLGVRVGSLRCAGARPRRSTR
jgi:uncharacterized integral membrane protein (TIGR00698 family)